MGAEEGQDSPHYVVVTVRQTRGTCGYRRAPTACGLPPYGRGVSWHGPDDAHPKRRKDQQPTSLLHHGWMFRLPSLHLLIRRRTLSAPARAGHSSSPNVGRTARFLRTPVVYSMPAAEAIRTMPDLRAGKPRRARPAECRLRPRPPSPLADRWCCSVAPTMRCRPQTTIGALPATLTPAYSCSCVDVLRRASVLSPQLEQERAGRPRRTLSHQHPESSRSLAVKTACPRSRDRFRAPNPTPSGARGPHAHSHRWPHTSSPIPRSPTPSLEIAMTCF